MPLLYLRFYLGSLSFLFAFYLLGHYLLGFPFPTPTTLLHLALGAGAGVGLVQPAVEWVQAGVAAQVVIVRSLRNQ